MTRPLPLAALAALALPWALASCGGGADAGAGAGEAAAPQAATGSGWDQKSGDLFNDDSTRILDRYGSSNPLYSKDAEGGSAMEGSNRSNSQFTRNFEGKEFQADEYEKKAFWGKKDYVKQVYGGNTDGSRFQQSSRFDGQSARQSGQSARGDGKAFAVSEYGTNSAREGSSANIERVSDAETDVRRRVYQQPEVRDWRAKRNISKEEARSLLGD